MPFDLLISNGVILTMEPDCLPFRGSIGITGGIIESVWPGSGVPRDAREFLDASGMIVIPGLFNGHVHGDMTIFRGLLEDLTLHEQNQKVAPHNYLFDYLTDEDRYLSRQLTYLEAVKSGTTFICENMYWSLGQRSIDAMLEIGINGALVEDVRPDFTIPDDFSTLQEIDGFFSKVRSVGLQPIIGGISEEDYSPERLEKIRQLQRQTGAQLTMHLAETNVRLDALLKNFGTSSIHSLERHGLLSPNLIGSHAIWIDDNEINLMAKHLVKVVNTPICEMKIADGIAPIPKYLQKGIPVCLGTDGALWNNSNDLFGEMKAMALLHKVNSGVRSITARQVLEMATINGAVVFGLDKVTGTLSEGKRADIILVDYFKPHMTPLRWEQFENVFSSLVFCATGKDVTFVIINGEMVVNNFQFKTMDESRIIKDAIEVSREICSRMPKDL